MTDPEVIRLQYHNDRLRELVDRLEHEKKAIQAKLDFSVELLADWCVAVNENGSGWDYWDGYYKEAMWGNNLIRELIDAKLKSPGGEL